MSAVEQHNESFDLRLLWLLLIPGVLVVGLLSRVFLFHVHDASPSAATSTVQVTVPTEVGRCAVPTAQQLSQEAIAVEADVTSVDSSTAVLRTTRVLAGRQVGQIRISLPASKQPVDAGIPTFATGKSYLLAISSDGTLAGCGLSGPASGDLEKLYTSAFG